MSAALIYISRLQKDSVLTYRGGKKLAEDTVKKTKQLYRHQVSPAHVFSFCVFSTQAKI